MTVNGVNDSGDIVASAPIAGTPTASPPCPDPSGPDRRDHSNGDADHHNAADVSDHHNAADDAGNRLGSSGAEQRATHLQRGQQLMLATR